MLRGIHTDEIYKNKEDLQILASSLSVSEKLLILSFGYQMSASDGTMNPKEVKYLQTIAKILEISPEYLAILESCFQQQEVKDIRALEKVRNLLDPAQFLSLDPVLVDAATYIQDCLPHSTQISPKPEASIVPVVIHTATCRQDSLSPITPISPKSRADSSNFYTHLSQFQEQREKLSISCSHLLAILQQFQQRQIVSDRFLRECDRVFKKVNSQVFRVAVVGEFSKGKSTLLNALLGEKVQPTRAIPCSGTISVLKYGEKKRVICRYKDGTESEIPLSEYQSKASLSKSAAISNRTDEFLDSNLQEIIFETPDLELCRNGVEILDSPGLNEHPERTAITYKLIREADAIVFLTHAQMAFTDTERTVIREIKAKLSPKRPASNLFAIVNCMDLIDEEDDREDLQLRAERFLLGENAIAADRQIYYLSAKEALKARLDNRSNSYLHDFNRFTEALETFFTRDRGLVFMERLSREIQDRVADSFDEIDRYEKGLTASLNSHEERQQLVEKIGELSGRLVKIEILAKQILQDEVCNHLKGNLNLRMLGLESHLRQSSRSWSSSHNAWFSGKKVAQDYIQRFNQEVLDYFETWVEKYFYPEILKPSIERLEQAIEQEIQDIELELNSLVSQPQGKSFNWVFAKYFKFGAEVDFGLGGIIGTIVLGLAMLIPGIMFGPVLATILGVLFGGGTTVAGLGSLLDIDSKIKEYVIQEGLKKFQDSRSQVLDTVERTVKATFDDRVQAFENVVKNAMSVYENRLEQLSKLDSETAEQRQAEKAWIVEHRQQLEAAKQEIEEILSSMLKGTH
ncbi:MAG: dynamin family protein, partial [Geitlerinemataceae cyanobacterium]